MLKLWNFCHSSWSDVACIPHLPPPKKKADPKTRAFMEGIYFGSYETTVHECRVWKMKEEGEENQRLEDREWWNGEKGKATNPKMAWTIFCWAGYYYSKRVQPCWWCSEELHGLCPRNVWDLKREYVFPNSCPLCPGLPPGNSANLCRHQNGWSGFSTDPRNWGRQAAAEEKQELPSEAKVKYC